ncbi:hypothetical protein TNIN_416451 [Trichonephila inaurata madagascariensis]|uniref:Uncharacterized protein n=1 Tax=Trichonephila inaurata madagascariensis TaxID=2747483 RepID=A0A8X6X2F7_9ARAC|nr:hypothetical protein TNIN_416451 [Trichonephila inaurata madagascariensis]
MSFYKVLLVTWSFCFIGLVLSLEKKSLNNKEITKSSNHDSKHFQKRSHGKFYYDYPEDPGYYEYQGYNNNPLQIAGIAGSAGLALKTIKAKSILKLLKIPAGLAVLGGIAALAAGLAPPAVIGSINLPFQGKRKKRDISDKKLDSHFLNIHRRW